MDAYNFFFGSIKRKDEEYVIRFGTYNEQNFLPYTQDIYFPNEVDVFIDPVPEHNFDFTNRIAKFKPIQDEWGIWGDLILDEKHRYYQVIHELLDMCKLSPIGTFLEKEDYFLYILKSLYLAPKPHRPKITNEEN